jgi:hypothetical protein
MSSPAEKDRLEKAKGIAMKTVIRISSLAVWLGVLAMLGCETGEDLEGADSGVELEERGTSSYNTIAECSAIFHKGDGWISLCAGHNGWGNPNKTLSNGRTCKQVDCERNAEHNLSAYFFSPGCYCADGYKGPNPDAGLDPLPPGCTDAKAGKVTFCQKSETCRGTGTRTVNGYSCEDVRKGFAPLVCSGLFSADQWKTMRKDCCYASAPTTACTGAVCDPEGRLKCKELDVLDVNFYNRLYPDLQKAFGGDVGKLQNHYLTSGIREGRQPNAAFSPKTYLTKNPDVARVFGSQNYTGALTHWITYGMRECRPLK